MTQAKGYSNMKHRSLIKRNIRSIYVVIILLLSSVVVVLAQNKMLEAENSAKQIPSESGDLTKLDCITKGHITALEQNVDVDYKRDSIKYEVPNIELVDQDNNVVKVRDLLNSEKPVLMNFIYTSCTTICPVMTSGFTKVQMLKSDEISNIQKISITIDPENDSPKVLKKYSKRFHAEDGWLFLTGTLDDIVVMQNAFNAYRGDKMNHVPLTFLRGEKNKTWLRIEGFPTVDELKREYENIQTNKGTA